MTYPINADKTLVIWHVFDGDIVNAGYTSSNDTPAVKNWIERSGINFEIKEFSDNTVLLTAMQADELPDIIIIDYTTYSGGVMGMVDDGICIELTTEMLDGASHPRIMTRIYVPLSGTTLAVMLLYYAVGHWSAWFNASPLIVISTLQILVLCPFLQKFFDKGIIRPSRRYSSVRWRIRPPAA